MKVHVFISILLLANMLSAQNNLIFGGGEDDGYSEQHHNQVDNNNIFSGGNEDGYTDSYFSQPANNAVFGGGDDDGYSERGFAQPNNNSIFGGGNDDGYSEIHFAQADNNGIFGGGIDDGYSEISHAQQSNSSIFQGGDDDGYVCFYLETALPLRFPPILQVEWLSFDAKAIDAQVRLNWETTREINHQFFQVERSIDLLTVESVGSTVPAQGSATQGSQYALWDDSPLSGSSFYRVKAIDNNGELSYSEWKEVRFGDASSFSFTAFPNPVQNVLTAKITTTEPAKVNIRLIDLHGRVLWKKQHDIPAGETAIQINMETFSEGLYFLEIYSNEGKQKTVRILKRN